MSSSNRAKALIPIAILVVGVLGAMLMVTSRKAPQREERSDPGPLVEVVKVSQGEVTVSVKGHGEVVPKVSVDVVPQVVGRVTRVHPSLAAGGFFRAGETLVAIEARDYELAVDRARASVARASVALETQQAEAQIARQEWEALHPGEDPPSGLVTREPQVRQSEAELAAARADLDIARLNLQRTRVSVPFDGVVVSKSVDIGQFVGAGQKIARVYGTRAVEVRVPLEDDELAWFDTPGDGGGEQGPEARVRMTTGGRQHTWLGEVVRQEAEIDPVSRMVHVVIEVLEPFDRTSGRPALRPGSFVEVEIGGATLENTIAVPRYAIHEDDTVWVVNDGVLEVRRVSVARAERTEVLIESGLESGEALVVSALEAVTSGMKVRIEESAVETSDAQGEAR